MDPVSTTRMSSRGQVVIPEEVRKRLGLEPGARFLVVGEGDVVILKSIRPPSMRDFDDLVRKARRQAKRSGMKRADVAKAVRRTRERS